MKKINWKKQATKVGLFCILSSGIAVTTTTVLNNVSIVHAATVDESSARKITIHAYEKSDTNGVSRGNGVELNTSGWDAADKVPVADGTAFKIQRVAPLEEQPASSIDPKNSTTYEVDMSFGSDGEAVVTTSDGVANYIFGTGSANDGYYLVTFVNDQNGTTDSAEFQPTIVSIPLTNTTGDGFIYDVHIYPKVDTTFDVDADKYLDLLDSGDQSKKTESFFAGDEVTWDLDTKLPEVSKFLTWNDGTGKGIVITDTLNGDLSFNTADGENGVLTFGLYTKSEPTTGADYTEVEEVTFAYGADYTTVIANNSNPTDPDTGVNKVITATFTQDGYQKIYEYIHADADGHPERLTAEYHIIGSLKTIIDPDATGKISNEFTATVNGVSETSNGGGGIDEDPETPDPENPPGPSIYLGGFKFEKIDSSNNTISLADAEFKLATSQENAIAGRYLKKNTDGKIIDYGDNGYDSATDYVAVTGENGIGEFKGLKLTDHEKAPGEATDEELNMPRDYWISETKAPQTATSGYQLLTEPVKVTVTVTSYNDTAKDLVTIKNDKKFDLPFTGGAGLTALIAIAAALIGFAVFPFKKLRKNEK
ncbi:MAG: SpaH/EbpB family LPXTG-anchored major pilin [Lactobacillales bacterium]|nr:SpaH/EbpB family LPXTG-anchored major pilin [Lactobacillales bacterium]